MASALLVKRMSGLCSMMGEHEEFEVETDEVGELAMPFWSETVRSVVVE